MRGGLVPRRGNLCRFQGAVGAGPFRTGPGGGFRLGRSLVMLWVDWRFGDGDVRASFAGANTGRTDVQFIEAIPVPKPPSASNRRNPPPRPQALPQRGPQLWPWEGVSSVCGGNRPLGRPTPWPIGCPKKNSVNLYNQQVVSEQGLSPQSLRAWDQEGCRQRGTVNSIIGRSPPPSPGPWGRT